MAAGGSVRLDGSIEMRSDSIVRALNAALMAYNKTPNFSVKEFSKIDPPEVTISFSGSGSFKDWYSQPNFGETKVDFDLFSSLKSIGKDEAAQVNEFFQQRFKDILASDKPSFKDEVDKAMNKQKQIVFAGYSSGAPIAILATLWTLEKYQTPKFKKGIPPLCVTFGSPLVGNHIFSHATRRENWSRYFLHYVMKYDIMPLILLAPLSSLDEKKFESISQFFKPKSKPSTSESVGKATAAASDFYFAIMSNALTVTSHAASKLMGTTDTTLETLENFIPLSPYRPFGTYIFCTGNGILGKQVVIRNSDAVLQVLFFSAQLSQEEAAQVPFRSLQEHTTYGTELQKILVTQNVVYLDDQLKNLPLSHDAKDGINTTLNDLGLNTGARLSLRAAAELEVKKCENEDKIMRQKKDFVEERMQELEKYKSKWEHEKVGYYDGFREHKTKEDFQANVKRLQLAGVLDEVIEKLKSYELADEFEGKEEWIDLGTKFRKLVEPLDIANYYRHSRQYEGKSASYMVKGRPSRYRYPQRWLEHSKRIPQETDYSVSCFWAEVEELRLVTSNKDRSFEEVKERVVELEGRIKTWIEKEELTKDVLLKGSTLVKWWKTLPSQHKQESCIASLIKE
ncbi:hypothetical protein VNO77_42444 [Canavalia gladiata]|uniref:Uncharacterized protein n=1 Tax=Canavalia gladiata TaxID=3824 RepID=A0AAN9PP33_CANGL